MVFDRLEQLFFNNSYVCGLKKCKTFFLFQHSRPPLRKFQSQQEFSPCCIIISNWELETRIAIETKTNIVLNAFVTEISENHIKHMVIKTF